MADEYAALEATLTATPIGRWFLAEYLRRNQTPETQLMLDAITRLETAVLRPQRQAGVTALLSELTEIARAISRTRMEVTQLGHPDVFEGEVVDATEELDHIVEATEKATSEILTAAEGVQEITWTLRETGMAPEVCDKLHRHATDIYTACSFQDLTGQRTGKVVQALRLVEQRIEAVLEVWGVIDADRAKKPASAEPSATQESALLSGPQPEGEALAQIDVDQILTPEAAEDLGTEAPPAEDRPEAPSEPPEAPQTEPFKRPDPLTLPELHGVKRAALFG